MALVAFLQLQLRRQTVFTVHSMSVGMAKTNTLRSYAYTQRAVTRHGSIQKELLFTASIVGVDPTQTWGTGFHLANWSGSMVTKHMGEIRKHHTHFVSALDTNSQTDFQKVPTVMSQRPLGVPFHVSRLPAGVAPLMATSCCQHCQ